MNRRTFLRSLGLIAPVAAARPTYFLPPAGGWHSDTRSWHSQGYFLGDTAQTVEVTVHQLIRRHGSFYTVEYEYLSYNGIRLS